MSQSGSNGPRPDARRPWTQPTVTPTGTVGVVIAGGGGKVSASAGDPGDGRKPPGGGG